ncbi:Zinc knuckle CX2CX4HX4C [Arabidopsis thaliana x Arabidopsis arenosa]|uniref:Zinc knuckle CX2CX4HX4C n=1 Tax=Arabidopsis thaliana x Arabidopsis arenosa TaxID=1240361 RepID=A0A8T2BH89_9BRAS|nr:Zinc knuckle CX2CX4HX4C [Arabidopsis thaliana x Arabidopsis arenosa]
MEKWVEKPLDDYLMFLPVWVRLRNIPVNYYTKDTIEEIAECLGKVLEVALDLEKLQAQDYVRVQVLFNVSNPLRNSKEVQLPTGEIVLISFDYERIRKRCFQCQRLTHDKTRCPFKPAISLKAVALPAKHQEKLKGTLLEDDQTVQTCEKKDNSFKLMEDAMKGSAIKGSSMISKTLDDDYDDELSDLDLFVGFRTGSMDASSSGAAGNFGNPKKHKPSWQRKSKGSKELPLKNKVSVVDSKEKLQKSLRGKLTQLLRNLQNVLKGITTRWFHRNHRSMNRASLAGIAKD